MDWSNNEFIDNIGSYIYKVHIDGQYFVNFADADAKQVPSPGVVYTYGETLKDDAMKGFAAYVLHLRNVDNYLIGSLLGNGLHELYLQMKTFPEIKAIVPKAPQPLESWLPELQVLTLRSKSPPKGLFLGAKAGTNG